LTQENILLLKIFFLLPGATALLAHFLLAARGDCTTRPFPYSLLPAVPKEQIFSSTQLFPSIEDTQI